MMTASGFRNQEEKSHSINVRELKTILFALQHHAKRCENSMIKIYSDNITALKYIYIAKTLGMLPSQPLGVEGVSLPGKFLSCGGQTTTFILYSLGLVIMMWQSPMVDCRG